MHLKDAIRFTLALGAAIALMLMVRAWAFEVVSVSDNALAPALRKGQRLLVNRLQRDSLERGCYVVFAAQGATVARVEALPGDTITLAGQPYLVPSACCNCCRSNDCHTFVVGIGQRHVAIQRHDIVGKAYPLFRLPF